MKKRFLPIGFFSMLMLGLIALFLLPSVKEANTENANKGAQTIAGAKKYLASIRNNQHTGLLNPKDVIDARKQIETSNFKSGTADEFQWIEMGPTNIGGRTRAIIFDNRDSEAMTMYAGSVTGGLFKTTNLASTWEKINTTNGTANLNVSSMVQTSDGTIYVGTGEGLSTQNYTSTGDLGYDGGFVGKGIFKSDGNDNFTLVNGTAPSVEDDLAEWAYINELAIDTDQNRLFAGTNTGLKYASLPNLDDWDSNPKYTVDSLIVNREIDMDSTIVCDSFDYDNNGNLIIYGSQGWQINTTKNDTTSIEETHRSYVDFETQGNCYDVKVSPDGYIIAVFNNKVYVSEDGNTEHFKNRSIYPENPESIRKDNLNRTTHFLIKNTTGETLLDSLSVSNVVYDWHIDYYQEAESSKFNEYPDADDAGRIEFAIAPSSPNVVYALASDVGDNSLLAVYLSQDNGQSWRIIAPGGSDVLNILGATYTVDDNEQFYYQGDFCNTLEVFPNDPYRILAGGVDLWLGRMVNSTGPYTWSRKSESDATAQSVAADGIFSPLYVHMDHHVYKFRPGYGNKFVAGTDGGVYQGTVSGENIAFVVSNKNYNCTQFYSVGVSYTDNIIIGGTQDNGPSLIQGGTGVDMWHGANIPTEYPDGSDGASVAISNLTSTGPGPDDVRVPTTYYSKTDHPTEEDLQDRMRRSESLAVDFALDFVTGFNDEIFINPMLLWESYDNENSRDSVKFTANQAYVAGDNVVARSNNIKHPFNYTLPIDMAPGDTLMVKDIISNKLFIAKTDAVYMSLDSYDFTLAPSWYEISASDKAGFEGLPLSMAVSEDANQLYVGTKEGRLFKISNIALAYNEDRADVGSSGCIIATQELDLGENTQAVTSLAVDPTDGNKLLVTLGNYGNTEYVYYSSNALSDAPTFTSVQDGLPTVPIYSSIFEMDPNTDQVIIGTEIGLWACDDITNPEWYATGTDIGEIPVMDIKQQCRFKGSFTLTYFDPVTNDPFYEYFASISNYGDIYIATHGRGIFKIDMDYVGVDETPAQQVKQNDLNLNVYPNPAVDDVTISLNVQESNNAQLSIFDLSGKLVISMDLGHVSSGNVSVPVNLSKLNQGSYLVQVTVGSNTATNKIIIK